jgi:uncharacterized protein
MGLLSGILAAACALPAAHGQAATSIERYEFEVSGTNERRAAVVGEIRIPESVRDRLPAVVIVNSSPGFDGRGAFYAEALNHAGIATLEVDMFQGRGLPSSPVENMPHAFQSLRHLARHPRIDPARIGIMGFSWGAQIALVASSAELARRYGKDNLQFAAHLPLYPQCWVVRTARNGKDKRLQSTTFKEVTRAPVHILAGDLDGYDDPDGCQKFVASLPAHARRHFAVTVYKGATFAWDSRFASASYEAGANKGQGGIVSVVPDAEIARESLAFAVSFFKRHLAPD